MANINLLPWREQLREERKREFLVALGAVTVAAVIILFIGDRYVNNGINNQEELNAYLQQKISELDLELTEIRELRAQKAALTERMAVIQDLQGTRPVIVRLFDELVRTLPEGVYYNTIRRTGNVISLEGVAESNGRVSALMRDLEASEWFSEPNLQQVTADPNGASAGGLQTNTSNVFQLSVTVTTPNLGVIQ